MESLEDYVKSLKEEKNKKEEEKKKKGEEKKKKEEDESKIPERIPLFTNRREDKIKISAKTIEEVLKKLRSNLFTAKDVKELGKALIDFNMNFLKNKYTDKEIEEISKSFSEEKLKNIGNYLKYLSENYKDDKVGAMKGRQNLITTLLETGMFGWPYDREIKIIDKGEGKTEIIQKYKFTNLQRIQASVFLSFLKDITQSEELGSKYKNFLEYINASKQKEIDRREKDKEKKREIFGPHGDKWKELPESQKYEYMKKRNIMRAYKNQRYAIKVNYALEYPELFSKGISLKRLDKYYRPGVGTIPAEYTFNKGKDIQYKIEKPTGLKHIEREMEALRAQGFNKKETIEAMPEFTREQFESYKPTFAPPPGSEAEKKRLKDMAKHILLYYNPPVYDTDALIREFINKHGESGKEAVDKAIEEIEKRK